MDGLSLRAYEPDDLSNPLGPLVANYLDKSVASPFELVESILHEIVVIPSEVTATNAKFIPGCFLGGKVGPKPAEIMVIGKIPYDTLPIDISEFGIQLTHPLSVSLGAMLPLLCGMFEEAGFTKEEYDKFYYTNIVRFGRLDNGIKKTIPVAWVRECSHFLEQELLIVKPKWILCLGAEATKAVLKSTVKKSLGVVHTYTGPVGEEISVVCAQDPRTVLMSFESKPSLVTALKFFRASLNGTATDSRPPRNYFYIDDVDQLDVIADQLIAADIKEFTIDCEWGNGQSWLDTGAKLRTIQIAWSGSDAVVVILRRAGMREAFMPDVPSAFRTVRKLLCRPGIKVIGHGISADFCWLKEAGIDISGVVYFDTMLASHLFEPTATHDLESLVTRTIEGWPKYDVQLEKWKTANPIPDGKAYGDIPDEILHEYAADDSCATFLLYKHYEELFTRPGNERLSKLFYSLVMPADLSLMEMSSNGVYMDKPRLIQMEQQYQEMYNSLLMKFRTLIGDGSFNPNSAKQKVALLFNQLQLPPLKTTGKYPLMWDDVVESGEEFLYSPAVDDETLGTLAAGSVIAKRLQEICLIGTVLKSFLVPKVVNKITGISDYSKGLIGFIKPDGRLHTRISQMLKTGRLASAEPNLQHQEVLKLFELLESLRIQAPQHGWQRRVRRVKKSCIECVNQYI